LRSGVRPGEKQVFRRGGSGQACEWHNLNTDTCVVLKANAANLFYGVLCKAKTTNRLDLHPFSGSLYFHSHRLQPLPHMFMMGTPPINPVTRRTHFKSMKIFFCFRFEAVNNVIFFDPNQF